MTNDVHIEFDVCPSMETSLNLFLDGELPSNEQRELYLHLAQCEECRRFLDSMLIFRKIAREENLAVPPQVDEAFFERLAAHKEAVDESTHRADRRERRREKFPRVGRLITIGCVVALVAGTVLATSVDWTSAHAVVSGEEELVNFPILEPQVREQGAVYVFYPGLTIEAENWVEPASIESL
jgi:anti-sigma factor RsiW